VTRNTVSLATVWFSSLHFDQVQLLTISYFLCPGENSSATAIIPFHQ